MDELETMRIQLNSLKQRLASQKIINQDLMKKVMQNKTSWLNNLVLIEIILLPVTYLFFAGLCAYFDISQWLAFIYLVVGAIDTAFDWYLIRIPSRMFSTASVVEFQKLLIRQKKGRLYQVCISTPLSLMWMTALIFSLFRTDGFVPLVGVIIGGIAGIVAVIVIYRKIQTTNDDLLQDIKDFEEEYLPDTPNPEG